MIGFLMTIIVNGQDKKISLGISGSLDFYKYQFNDILDNSHSYKNRINYSTGLTLNYNFNEKFAVKTGLLLSTKGYILDYNWILIDPSDPAIPSESNMKLSYLDIPLWVSYNYLKIGKLTLLASTGVVTSLLINEKEVSTMGDGSIKETDFAKKLLLQKLNSTLLAIEIELGLKYNINDKIFISLEPYFRHGLNKISDDVLKSNPNSYGANLGFHIYL